MEIKKYKEELETLKESLESEKPILPTLHTLEVREQNFKNFFKSKEETAILKEWNFECFSDLENYEKELKLGKFGD